MVSESRGRSAAILTLCALTAACDLPRDPEGTSERVASTRELRVGVADNPPWTDSAGAEPSGVEPNLVRRYAASTGARVLWSRGSETSLIQSLKHHELDLVIGGVAPETQRGATAGATQAPPPQSRGQKDNLLSPPR